MGKVLRRAAFLAPKGFLQDAAKMRWGKLRNGMLPTKRLQHPPGEVQCAGVLGRAACLARKAVKSSGITGCCLAKSGSKIRRERCRGRWEASEAKLVLNVAF